jgi:Pyruvate/2-oxoacid:ferredoxin oxidoreductase delta subunit
MVDEVLVAPEGAQVMRVAVLCFSPTGTTRAVCVMVARGIGDPSPTVLDLTLPGERTAIRSGARAIVLPFDHVIVGIPVYLGKIPPLASELLSAIRGHGRRASAVAVYGNRDFGVALRRLCEKLVEAGFELVSAGAFVGQHSYSEIIPVALGRPDEADLDSARRFGARSALVTTSLVPSDVEEQLDVFSKSASYEGLYPSYSQEACTECGECHAVCPAGLIAEGTGAYVGADSQERCIGCMACVRACPGEGRRLQVSLLQRLVVRRVLRKAARERQEPKVFFPV